jgi:cullin-4
MLLDITKLPPAELKRTLQSLCLSDTVRLLVKDPKSKSISDSDSFSVDLTFRSPLFRIKVPSLQLKETKEEQRSVTSKVFEDRQYAIDACIVRIMKARKVMTHAQLMSEVIAAFASKFPVKMGDIKKRIGTLIEREYMERDKDNSQVYNYQA